MEFYRMTTPTPPILATIRWRRLDIPGEDNCGLFQEDRGWSLRGKADYVEKGLEFSFDYRVQCDVDWGTDSCHIKGRIGEQAVLWEYLRKEGVWFWNGEEVTGLAPGLDIDLGFSPATNLAQLRRLNLTVGDSTDMPVAWLDPENGSLSYLTQHYRRVSVSRYAYESPTVGYAETLEVDPASGFALRYPGLWVAVD